MTDIIRSLVIDQASEKLGFAIVDHDPTCMVGFGVCGRLIAHGRILAKQKALVDRRAVIRADVKELIRAYQPHEIVVENTAYVGAGDKKRTHTGNVMAAIMALLEDIAKDHELGFYTQHPNSVKLAVTGDGKADKVAVTDAVCRLWGLFHNQIKDDNHADALAGAWRWLAVAEDERAKVAAKRKGKK